MLIKRFKEITDTVAPGIKKGAYYVAKDGDVISEASNKRRYIKGAINNDNYTVLNLKLENGKSKVFYLHRLIMMSYDYVDGCEDLLVNHLDGNKQHNELSNYEWSTIPLNNKHAKEHGLLCVGEDCPWAHLNNDQVNEICKILESKSYDTLKEIADVYNVQTNVIRDIAIGETWKHISCNYNIEYTPRKSPTRKKK